MLEFSCAQLVKGPVLLLRSSGHCCGMISFPGSETSACHTHSQKKKKEKEEEESIYYPHCPLTYFLITLDGDSLV